jgi:hypothetical protein
MFKSVSKCTPNSRITVSFVATKNEILIVNDPEFAFSVLVYVNGTQFISQPIAIQSGELVEIELDTPATYGAHKFINYSLDGVDHSFAIVNKDNYQPRVKENDAPRRWFNYFPKTVRVSFHESDLYTQIDRPLGRTLNIVDIDRAHIVLDHITGRVNFYYFNRELITSVTLPSGPVEYTKSTYTDELGDIRTELFVICVNKILYRIRFNNRFSASGEFFPTVSFIRSLEEIWYEADLPTGQSFIDARRNSIRQRINPPMTALDVFGANIWVAGYDTVYILNKNFQEINKILIGTEKIVAIACLNETNAYAVTRDGKIIHCVSTGYSNVIYSTSDPLGNPTRFTPPGEAPCILIPDPNNRRLLKLIAPAVPIAALAWDLGDFAPAYARTFGDSVWVTGHDTNRVLQLKSRTDITEYHFKDKVTVVSVQLNDQGPPSVLAVHYLRNYTTLDLTGIRRTIPIDLKSYRGPLSHIGSRQFKLILLGAENMPVYGAPGVTCWINGIDGENATSGDHFSVSYQALSVGKHSVAFVLGNQPYDFEVESFSNTEKEDNFVPVTTAINRLPAGYANANVVLTPTTGNVYSGSTKIDLNFEINFFGQKYSTVNISTEGYITFGNNYATSSLASVGSLNADAIYVESGTNPRSLNLSNLFQTSPNSNLTGVTAPKPLPSGRIPGVYYIEGENGDDRYLRVAWVGAGGDNFPLGNNVPTTTFISNSSYIPVDYSRLVDVQVSDYVVGNSITSSTQVTGKRITAVYDFEAYDSQNNDLFVYSYTDTVTSLPKYSEILSFDRYVVSTSKSTLSSGFGNGYNRNTTLKSDDYSIIVNGSINPLVTQYHSVIVPVLSPIGPYYKTDVISYDFIETNALVVSEYSVIANVIANTYVVYGNTFVISNADAQFFHVGQEVLSSNISLATNPKVVSKSVHDNGTAVVVNANVSLAAGDFVQARQTTINFSTYDPVFGSRVELNNEVTYELSKITLDASALVVVGNSIDIQGYFIDLNKPVTAFKNSVFNFKTELPVKEYTYEVGFYVGKRFQYIEVFYDNTNHQSSVETAIASRPISRSNVITRTSNVASGASYVFVSELGTGYWQTVGLGSFDFKVLKTSLKPNFVLVPADTPNDSNIEFLIEQEFTTASNVLLSTSIGKLTVNGGEYRGRNFIKENDIVRLKVEFNKSLRAVAPIISIGDFQFPVSTITSAASSLLTEHKFLTDYYNLNALFSYTLTVPAVDNYYIPEYYRSSLTDVYKFTLTRNTNEIPLFPGNSYNLLSTDQITIEGILSSSAIYDTREIIFIGERNSINVSVRTNTPGLINYLNFGTITEPYLNNTEYITLPGNLIQINEDIGYASSNLTITTSANISTANLYLNDLGANFISNGNISTSRWLPNVAIGSNVGIHRDFVDYFQGNATVYQVYYDSYATSNVYIPVGNWAVVNQSITGNDLVQTTTLLGPALTNHSSLNGTVIVSEIKIQPLFLRPFTFVSDSLTPLVDRFFQFPTTRIESAIFITPSYLNIRDLIKIIPDTTPPVVCTGRLFSQLNTVGSLIGVRRITVDEFRKFQYIVIGQITSDVNSLRPKQIFINSIESEVEPIKIHLFIDSIRGSWLPNATEWKDKVLGLKDETASLFVDRLPFNNTDIFSLWISSIRGLAEAPWNEIQTGHQSTAPYNFTVWASRQKSLLEPLITDDLNQIFLSDLERVFSYMYSGPRTFIEPEDFAYWYFSWKNAMAAPATEFWDNLQIDTETPNSEMPAELGRITDTPNTEMPGRNGMIVDQGKREAFVLRIFRELRKIYTEFNYEYGQRVDEERNEFLFDTVKPEVETKPTSFTKKPGQYMSRPEEALVNAPGYIYFQPIDKLLMFVAPPEKFITAPDNFKLYLGYYIETENNKLFSELIPELEQAPLRYLDLIPIIDFSTLLGVDLIPVLGQIPVTLIDFVPVLEQKPIINLPLELMLDIIPEQLIPLEYSLFQEIYWEMDDITVSGTYSTKIKTWVDQGQYSDYWNLKRKPNTNILYGRSFDLIKMYSKEYNYVPGGFVNDGAAEDEMLKYYNAGILPIPGTSYWNYRIYFKQRHFCVPKKGIIFPANWSIRGG